VEWDGRYAHVAVSTTAGHAMVVLDLDGTPGDGEGAGNPG
jgi:hypothetical protein